ncbi:peptidase S8/S53 domain-containing protein [Lactarius deliciosus]|nr:peptidase S8/S53 domain-containing protein [Lactarius deliciosus]
MCSYRWPTKLGASYQLYRHAKVNATIIRTVSYALPEVLHAHIQAIAPTTYFASTQTLRQTPRRCPIDAAAALAEAEAASGDTVTMLSGREVEVATALDVQDKQYPSETDLTVFMTHFRSDVQPPSLATFTVELVNGGEYDPDNPGEEANLDVQYSSAMAYPTQIIFYSIGDAGRWVTKTGEPYSGDESLDYLLKRRTSRRPSAYHTLGARGVTVLFPSGGGTTDYDPEVAAPLSGGGFSDYFPRPVYQDVAVSAFLERQGTQYSGFYNPEGRGIPDIAAQAFMLPAVVRNDGFAMDGTSCSAPIVAGTISLLNDYLITNGRPPLGSLNIRLYNDGFSGPNDITSGSNPGCDTDGFSAVPGWDPVTGLGTPEFENPQNIFMIPLGGGAGQGNQPKIRGPGK